MNKANYRVAVMAVLAIAASAMMSGCLQGGLVSPFGGSETNQSSDGWAKITEGSDLAYKDSYANKLVGRMTLNNGKTIEKAALDLITGFVESYPVTKRDAILRGLTSVNYSSITHPGNISKAQKVRFTSIAQRDYKTVVAYKEYTVSIDATVSDGDMYAYLTFIYTAKQNIFPISFSAVIDGVKTKYEKPVYDSIFAPEIDFPPEQIEHLTKRTFTGEIVCDLRYKKYRNLADQIISSKNAVIIAEFTNGRSVETQISDTDRINMGILLKAVDAAIGD
ncbi:MAG: hypothetical protein LBE89_05860 [Helicobacteraceae bacterium]|jgi:hypothetical protein|nr:hypothetical protein [Helicobacteraceae bacterium]